MSVVKAKNIDWSQYDFLDIGCSKGSSISYAANRFRANKGLGVDIDPKKCFYAGKNHDVVYLDAVKLEGNNVVKFVTMIQMLEHLENITKAKNLIKRASELATDFIFIQIPSFEDEFYLKNLGFKLYWQDWTGHTLHARLFDYLKVFRELGLDDYYIEPIKPLKNSMHQAVIPSTAKTNSLDYDQKEHGYKPNVDFTYLIFQHIEIYIWLDPTIDKRRIIT